jgi:hypothetical protein
MGRPKFRMSSVRSLLPLRSNWRNIPIHLLSNKEILATTDRIVRKNRSNWLALEHLPEANWLNGQVLVGSCGKWNYSRWSTTGPDAELVMGECQGRISLSVSLQELRVALSQNILCFNERSKHFYSRVGNLHTLTHWGNLPLTKWCVNLCRTKDPL